MSLIGKLAVHLIRLYQQSLARVLPGRCRFYPSCSEYAVECFHRYNPGKAAIKSAYRILRCNPLSQGYFDPVEKAEDSAGS